MLKWNTHSLFIEQQLYFGNENEIIDVISMDIYSAVYKPVENFYSPSGTKGMDMLPFSPTPKMGLWLMFYGEWY